MSEKKKLISFLATNKECAQLACIKVDYGISQDSAILRFLINKEYKKILAKNVSIEQRGSK